MGPTGVSSSAQASITQYHSLDGLNNRHPFLIVIEAEKSKIKVPADLVLLRTLFLTCRWPAFHSTFTQQREQILVFLPRFIRASISSWAPILMALSKHNHLPKATLLIPSLGG